MNMQNVKVGDVVLIHNDGPRLHWKLGITDSLIQGNDGLVCAVNVRLTTELHPDQLADCIHWKCHSHLITRQNTVMRLRLPLTLQKMA